MGMLFPSRSRYTGAHTWSSAVTHEKSRVLGARAGLVIWSLFKGSALGLLLGGASVIALFILTPPPAGNTPPAAPLTNDPIVTSEAEAEIDEVAPDAIAETDPVSPTPNPDVPQPAAVDDAVITEAEPATVPEAVVAAPEADVPIEPEVDVAAAPIAEPVLPTPQSLAPQARPSEGLASIETQSATQQQIVVDDDASQAPVDPDETEATTVIVVPESVPSEDDAPMEVEVADTGAADAPVAVAQAPDLPLDNPEDEGADADRDTAVTASTPESSTVATAPTVPEPTIDADLSEDQLAEAAAPNVQDAWPIGVAEVAVPDDPAVDAAALATPVADLPERAEISTPDPVVIAALPPALAEEIVAAPEPQETSAPTDVASSDTDLTSDESNEASSVEPAGINGPRPVVVNIGDRGAIATALPTGSSRIKVNRPGTALAVEPEVQEEVPVTPQDAAPIEAFAASFENPDALPLLSIVLTDDPNGDVAPDELAALPFAATVVLEPTTPNVTERMAAYRGAGIEVAFSIAAPVGATASDLAVALEAGLFNVPQAVALVDLAGVAARNRALSDYILQIASDEGRGVVFSGRALGSGLRTAQSAGVQPAQIYRALETAQQDARVIGRFLDQAAFKARQDGYVVLSGQLNRQTLDALKDFEASARGAQVALAPISAVLALP